MAPTPSHMGHPLRRKPCVLLSTQRWEALSQKLEPTGGTQGTHLKAPEETARTYIQRAFQVSPERTLLNLIFVQGPKLILIIKPQRRKSEGKGRPRDTGRPDSDLSVHNSEYLNNGDSASHSTLLKVWTREISDEPPDPGIPSNHAHSLPHDCSEPVCPLPTNKAGARIRTH